MLYGTDFECDPENDDRDRDAWKFWVALTALIAVIVATYVLTDGRME